MANISNHRLYNTWAKMLQRCYNPKDTNYSKYGAKGITVSQAWRNSTTFIADMQNTFEEGLTLDRIDPTAEYSKQNCRWATPTTQACNTKKLRVTNTSGYRGVKKTPYGKWQVTITVNKICIRLGNYTTALEGARAYDAYIHIHALPHTLNGVELYNTI